MKNRQLLVPLALVLAASLAGCKPAGSVTYIPEGGTYTASNLAAKLEGADVGSASDIKTADAPDIRQKALANLRREGDDAAALADVLTSEFPLDIAAVPVIVEHGTYEGEDAWIIIEVWGDPDSTLAHRRIWVFSYDERSVVAAQSLY